MVVTRKSDRESSSTGKMTYFSFPSLAFEGSAHDAARQTTDRLPLKAAPSPPASTPFDTVSSPASPTSYFSSAQDVLNRFARSISTTGKQDQARRTVQRAATTPIIRTPPQPEQCSNDQSRPASAHERRPPSPFSQHCHRSDTFPAGTLAHPSWPRSETLKEDNAYLRPVSAASSVTMPKSILRTTTTSPLSSSFTPDAGDVSDASTARKVSFSTTTTSPSLCSSPRSPHSTASRQSSATSLNLSNPTSPLALTPMKPDSPRSAPSGMPTSHRPRATRGSSSSSYISDDELLSLEDLPLWNNIRVPEYLTSGGPGLHSISTLESDARRASASTMAAFGMAKQAGVAAAAAAAHNEQAVASCSTTGGDDDSASGWKPWQNGGLIEHPGAAESPITMTKQQEQQQPCGTYAADFPFAPLQPRGWREERARRMKTMSMPGKCHPSTRRRLKTAVV